METKEQAHEKAIADAKAARVHLLATTAKVRSVRKGSGYIGNGIQVAKLGGLPPTSFVVQDNQDHSLTVYGEYEEGKPCDISAIATLTAKVFPLLDRTDFYDIYGRERYSRVVSKSPYVPPVKPVVVDPCSGMKFSVVNLGSPAARVVLSLNWHDKAFGHTSFVISLVDAGDKRPPITIFGKPMVLTEALYNSYINPLKSEAEVKAKAVDEKVVEQKEYSYKRDEW